jgi:hypothetical protein
VTEVDRSRALALSLRIWAAMALFIFVPLLGAFLVQAPILAENGGALNWSIWNDVVCKGPTGACRVPPMLFVIYIVWSLFLLVAAENPSRYASFLRFTMWANFAHAGLMAFQALSELDRYWSKVHPTDRTPHTSTAGVDHWFCSDSCRRAYGIDPNRDDP